MKPATFPEQTGERIGPPGSDILPLPVCADGEQSISCWRASWRERLEILFTGRVWLSVLMGGAQPPVYVGRKRDFWPATRGRNGIPRLTLKRIFRYAPPERKIRLFAVIRNAGMDSRGQGGYSSKLSLSLRPVVARWRREWTGWRLVLLGLDVHYQRSFGGRFS